MNREEFKEFDKKMAKNLLDKCQTGDTEKDHVYADNLIELILIEVGLFKTSETYKELTDKFLYA